MRFAGVEVDQSHTDHYSNLISNINFTVKSSPALPKRSLALSRPLMASDLQLFDLMETRKYSDVTEDFNISNAAAVAIHCGDLIMLLSHFISLSFYLVWLEVYRSKYSPLLVRYLGILSPVNWFAAMNLSSLGRGSLKDSSLSSVSTTAGPTDILLLCLFISTGIVSLVSCNLYISG